MNKAIIVVLALAFSLALQSQNVRKYRQLVETKEMPKKVLAEFNARYPSSFVKMWYITHVTYWYQDYGPSYYDPWYRPRQVVVYDFSEPAYYEVDFMKDGANCRAIFNRYGTWFETRVQVDVLPEKVEKGIDYSEYAGWMRSKYMERIEAPGMPGSVYRLNVSNDTLSHIIRLNEKGEIVQVKTE